jgi:hypothetical protein
MPKTRKYQNNKKKSNKNTRKNQKGGVKGWIGRKITVSDKSITNDTLFRSKNYKWHRGDKYKFDIYNLPKSVADLNNYFRTKKKINPKTKKPIYGKFANIDVIQAKLSKCSSMLSAGNQRTTCLNFEYEWKIDDRVITVYRQLGPIQYFIENKSLELQFISILNMLELVHTVSDTHLDEYDINLERMSLLVKDLTKKEFDAITEVEPSKIIFEPITKESFATEDTLLSPTSIPEPFLLRDQFFLNETVPRSKEKVKESRPPAQSVPPAPPALSANIPPAPPLPPTSHDDAVTELLIPREAKGGTKKNFKRTRFNVTVNKI